MIPYRFAVIGDRRNKQIGKFAAVQPKIAYSQPRDVNDRLLKRLHHKFFPELRRGQIVRKFRPKRNIRLDKL